MSFHILLLVIIVQIALFQFLSVPFARSVFAVRLGSPPAPPPDEAAAYLHKTARARFTLGALLALATSATLLGIPAEPGLRKLFLAAVSVTSSIAFVTAIVRDRRMLRSIRERLPDSGVRRASLEPARSAGGTTPCGRACRSPSFSPPWRLRSGSTIA